jgi:hypothetical protein
MVYLTEKQLREAIESAFDSPVKYAMAIDLICERIIEQNEKACNAIPEHFAVVNNLIL